ncbi:SpoIVB peptidase [[Clostridium] colinum]|uniref:SpoIVB peptidase n=1 Tax=[Clostridium] colinum TaxID=36835 RepID=UPI002023D3B3|nr:SpoIVB peptidase [[Clostridium] colinum]
MQKLNKKYFYIIGLILVSLIFVIPIIINFMFFPKQINLLAGNIHKLDFNIPAVATIVSNDDSVINVNNKPLEEKSNINLNETVYLQSEKEGAVNMKVSLIGIPIKNVTVSTLPNTKLIPCGDSIGVRIDTQGVMVLGLGSVIGEDGKEYEPSKNILQPGDMILKINNEEIDSKETLIKCIENNDILNMEIKRNNKLENLVIKCVKGQDGKNKIGVWVRDSTQGIGTITYINPETKYFGALGHGIVDVDTKEIMEVKDGKIMKSNIVDIKKGEKGSPGELVGNINKNETIGNITNNTNVGIYGKITNDDFFDNKKATPIGLKDSVEIGPASILCNIDGEEVKEYDIEIESINKYNIDNSKSMVIRITDKELLEKTNGIIQGMSGSPIIQNGNIIGAITHVFVNEPSKGYGIFIENMLNNEQKHIG